MLADERLCDPAMPPPRPTRQQLNPLLRGDCPQALHSPSSRRSSLHHLTFDLTRESDNGRWGGEVYNQGGSPRRRGARVRATSHPGNGEHDLRDPHKATCALCGCVATKQSLSSASFSSLQSTVLMPDKLYR